MLGPRKQRECPANSASWQRQKCFAVHRTFERAAIASSLRSGNSRRGGVAAFFAAGSRQNQNWESDCDQSYGGLGWNCGWGSDGKYFAALAAVWRERGEINLGRGGCCRFSRGAG